MTAKVCRHCRIEKPAASFPVNAKLRDGLDSWCRECHRQAVREWSAKHYVPRVRQPRLSTPRIYKPRPTREAVCPMCQTSFTVSRERLTYCSAECSLTARRSQKRGHQATRALPRNTQECPQCFKSFLGTRSKGLHFCSPECGRIYHRRMDRDRRRAQADRSDREIGRVLRHQVYTRDDWRCQICGELVDRTVDSQSSLGPTLDHIVPLSRGGEHVMANLQLAHRLCNMKKGTGSSVSVTREDLWPSFYLSMCP